MITPRCLPELPASLASIGAGHDRFSGANPLGRLALPYSTEGVRIYFRAVTLPAPSPRCRDLAALLDRLRRPREDAMNDAAQPKLLLDPYGTWAEREGVPIVEDFGVDLLGVPTAP